MILGMQNFPQFLFEKFFNKKQPTLENPLSIKDKTHHQVAYHKHIAAFDNRNSQFLYEFDKLKTSSHPLLEVQTYQVRLTYSFPGYYYRLSQGI